MTARAGRPAELASGSLRLLAAAGRLGMPAAGRGGRADTPSLRIGGYRALRENLTGTSDLVHTGGVRRALAAANSSSDLNCRDDGTCSAAPRVWSIDTVGSVGPTGSSKG